MQDIIGFIGRGVFDSIAPEESKWELGYMTRHDGEMRKFISILMESSVYTTLSLSERQSLLERLIQSYPHFDDEEDAGKEDNFE